MNLHLIGGSSFDGNAALSKLWGSWASVLQPLHGGGFTPAFAQVATFYYATGALLHWGIPACLPVRGIQPLRRKPGVVPRDAMYSLGTCAGAASSAL
jgi:hypothetical protein